MSSVVLVTKKLLTDDSGRESHLLQLDYWANDK